MKGEKKGDSCDKAMKHMMDMNKHIPMKKMPDEKNHKKGM